MHFTYRKVAGLEGVIAETIRMPLSIWAVALITLALPASAAWEGFWKADSEDMFYLDPSTLKVAGTSRIAWMLTDFHVPQRQEIRSVAAMFEFDCAGGRSRARTMTMYAGRMGSGKSILFVPDDPFTPWQYPAPNTANSAALKLICSM
jgi:hypothetical protein